MNLKPMLERHEVVQRLDCTSLFERMGMMQAVFAFLGIMR